MFRFPKKGFTLIEIITVVVILGTLGTALYMSAQPYMKRTRDTKRVGDVISYMTILEAYEKNFDTYPSNYGSGGSLNQGYCLSEVYTRPNYIGFQDMQFQALSLGTSAPPRDPIGLTPISPCNMTGSYFYSRLDYSTNKQMAIIAVRLETQSSSNYGTGSDLIITGSVNQIMSTKKGTISPNAPDALYVVYRTR